MCCTFCNSLWKCPIKADFETSLRYGKNHTNSYIVNKNLAK